MLLDEGEVARCIIKKLDFTRVDELEEHLLFTFESNEDEDQKM